MVKLLHHGALDKETLFSPFLFIMTMDSLSRLLSKAEYECLIKGFRIEQDNLSITHIQFADDTILFFDFEDDTSVHHLQQVVNAFEQASGHNNNFHKSEIIVINMDPTRGYCSKTWS